MGANATALAPVGRGLRALFLCSIIFLTIGSLAAARAYAEDAPRPSRPPPGEALIYIYRAPSYTLSIYPALFDIDGVKIVKLNNKDYTWFYVPASSHVLRQSWGGMALLLATNIVLKHNDGNVYDWQDGAIYYYKFNTSFTINYKTMTIYWGSSPIEESQDLRELAVYKYVAPHDLDKIVRNPALSAPGTPAPASPANDPGAPTVSATPLMAPPSAAPSAAAPDSWSASHQADVDRAYVLGQSQALRQVCEGGQDQYWHGRLSRLIEMDAPAPAFARVLTDSFQMGYDAAHGEHAQCDDASLAEQARVASRRKMLGLD